MFEVENLTAGYGTLTVLHGVSLAIETGERAGYFGHNGSGKSSAEVSRRQRPGLHRLGALRGAAREPGATHRNVRLGIGMVPQTRDVFPDLFVDECLKIAGYTPDAQSSRAHLHAVPAPCREAAPAGRLHERRRATELPSAWRLMVSRT